MAPPVGPDVHRVDLPPTQQDIAQRTSRRPAPHATGPPHKTRVRGPFPGWRCCVRGPACIESRGGALLQQSRCAAAAESLRCRPFLESGDAASEAFPGGPSRVPIAPGAAKARESKVLLYSNACCFHCSWARPGPHPPTKSSPSPLDPRPAARSQRPAHR